MADASRDSPGAAMAALPSDAVIIVPVRNTVLFPGMVLPISVGRPGSVAAAQHALREQRQIGLLLQRDQAVDDPRAGDLYRVGTVAHLVRYCTAPAGNHHHLLQG